MESKSIQKNIILNSLNSLVLTLSVLDIMDVFLLLQGIIIKEETEGVCTLMRMHRNVIYNYIHMCILAWEASVAQDTQSYSRGLLALGLKLLF